MDLTEYQQKAQEFALYPGKDDEKLAPYPILGLAGEAGEVCEKYKKILRDNWGIISEEKKMLIILELGDVLWYISEIAYQLGFTLSEVAQINIDKLKTRKRNGTIKGEGDIR